MIIIEYVNLLHTAAADFTDCIFNNQQSGLTKLDLRYMEICPAVDNHITNLNGDAADSLNINASTLTFVSCSLPYQSHQRDQSGTQFDHDYN